LIIWRESYAMIGSMHAAAAHPVVQFHRAHVRAGTLQIIRGCAGEAGCGVTEAGVVACGYSASDWNILKQLTHITGAYVGPAAVDPSLVENILLSVNPHNKCSYCTSLHGELARRGRR
jgi:AhpD family alkylhydroperoxidase